MAKKLSTADIMAQIKKQSASGSGGTPSPDAAESSAQAEVAPAAEKPAAPKAAPKGTAGILSQIRTSGAETASPKPAPKGTAGILDSIRGGSGDAPTSAGKAAPVKQKAATVTPAGELPPVKDMIEKLKAGKGQSAAVSTAKPELKIPVRPSQRKPAAKAETRRGFLLSLIATPFALAWTVLATMTGVWVLALARFMFPNVLVEPPSQFKIGGPSDYPLGTVSTKWTAARGIWIVHTDQYKGKDQIYALASVCTHLGCTPSWLEGEQKFKCPCHGSGFYINGMNFEGPAPRPLERVGLSVAPDGMLEVDKSVKFQEEKGQWEDSKSFVDGTLV
jgi:cytochrome b6-f complex iron-sulfur subunit